MGMNAPIVKHADIKSMSFERALKELESIVERLEKGAVELEESIALYERGKTLREHCDLLLRQAEAKAESRTLRPHGSPSRPGPFPPAARRGSASPQPP